MQHQKIFFCLLFALLDREAMADAMPIECHASPVISAGDIDRTGCEISGSVIIERYLGPKPELPYTTAFDRREVAVAYGKTIEAVKKEVGIKIDSRGSQSQSLLLQPPLAENIAKRLPVSKVKKHNKWSIVYQIIEYGAQGGAQGYPLKCATAIRSTKLKTMVVAECFPFEEKDRFSKTLDAVH